MRSAEIRPATDDELPAFARFGPNATLMHPFTVSCPERISVGQDVYIGERSWLSVVDQHWDRRYLPWLEIGDGASLGPDLVVACIGRVEIGARVQSASRVFIGDTFHEFRDPDVPVIDQPLADPRPVRIGSGAFLGINSVVLSGVQIGARAYIAAGAVVTKDVPANTVVAGNPAEIVQRWDPDERRWVTPTRGSRLLSASVRMLRQRITRS
jgi:acetyltransferase-like isoleucine patch superfamily enzyme